MLKVPKKSIGFVGFVLLSLSMLLAPQASALDESATINYKVTPVKKKFSKKSFLPANLSWGLSVTPKEDAVTILPLRTADIKFPNNKLMRFSPSKKLKPCRLESTFLVAPAEAVYARCPNSVVGNGQATFQLGQSTSPLAFRQGTVVILYGGKSGKNSKLLFAAWSGDTNAGVVANGTLLAGGQMKVAMPVLTADSAVTSLQLNIPGKPISGQWGDKKEYKLRAGSDRGFVRVSCKMGQRIPFSTTLLLGSRNQAGIPYGLTQTLKPKSSSRCGR